MRKMSKNRTEEDAVSSTSGSIKADNRENVTNGNDDHASDAENDEKPEQENNDSADETAEESAADKPENDKEDTPPPRGPPKKRASKTRAKEAKAKQKEVEDEEEEEEEEYEVEEILDSKRVRGKLHYLIHWKGWPSSSDTWEPADTVSCPDLIKKFEEGQSKGTKKAVKRKAAPAAKKSAKKAKKGKTAKTKPAKIKKDFDYENADEDEEYEVERILEVHHKKNGKREFLIHWKGWSSRHDSWEPEEHLSCSDLIKKFMSKVSSARDKEQRELRVAPETTRRFTLAQDTAGRRLSKRGKQRQRVRYDGAE